MTALWALLILGGLILVTLLVQFGIALVAFTRIQSRQRQRRKRP